MSILAEPRRKQRISVDPQNIQWRDDENKISKKMMEKMGWANGKGLGRNNDGNVDAVKLKANHSGKGLGADKLASYDSTWIGHHDDFADLLAALNKNKPQTNETEEEKKERADKISIELSSKNVRRRIHYQKFTRMKDTSNYSENDKSAVLGVGLKRTKDESDEDKSEMKKPESEPVEPGNTTVSTLSVGDYFAAKMAALKAKSQVCAVAAVKQEIVVKTEVEDDYSTSVFSNSLCDVAVKIENEGEESEKARRKREKKLKKQQEQLANEEMMEEKSGEEENEEEAARKRRKEEKRQLKLLKRQQEEEEVAGRKEEVENGVEEEMTEKERRKMERKQRKMQKLEEAAAEEEPKKKKKKRDNI